MEDEAPQLENYEVSGEIKRWKPSPEVENAALETVKGIFPNVRASDKVLEQFYDKGYHLYKTGHYKDATSYFNLLTIVHPKHPKYRMALAASYHMLKDYQTAADCYAIAAILDEYNPIPQYHLAGCLIKLDQPFTALIALEMGYERCEELNRFQGLKDRMKLMMERLHKELAERKALGAASFQNPLKG